MLAEVQFHVESPISGTIPFTGPSLRSAFLQMARNYSTELGKILHDGAGSRPYAIDPLPFDCRLRTHLTEGELSSFSVRVLSSTGLLDDARAMILKQQDTIRIHNLEFPLRGIDFRQYDSKNLWEKCKARAKTQEARGSIHISFQTPTQLSQFGSDMAYLLPDPEKVFSSLLRLWNLAAEEMIVEPIGDYRQWVQREVYVSRHKIKTSTAHLGQRRSVVGFVGDVTFSIRQYDSTLAPLTSVLAKFSELTNIGKNRTAGFGKVQARVVSPG